MRSTCRRQELGLGLGWVGVSCPLLHGPTPEEGPPGLPTGPAGGGCQGHSGGEGQRCRAGPVQVVLTQCQRALLLPPAGTSPPSLFPPEAICFSPGPLWLFLLSELPNAEQRSASCSSHPPRAASHPFALACPPPS